jgi:hypothetical protein
MSVCLGGGGFGLDSSGSGCGPMARCLKHADEF